MSQHEQTDQQLPELVERETTKPKTAAKRKRVVDDDEGAEQEAKPKRVYKKKKTDESVASTDAAAASAASDSTPLAPNQQIYYGKKCWKPYVGETCLLVKKGSDPTMLTVKLVGLVEPSVVPNDLVVEAICSVGHLPDAGGDVRLVLLRSGDWVQEGDKGKKTKHRAAVHYQPMV